MSRLWVGLVIGFMGLLLASCNPAPSNGEGDDNDQIGDDGGSDGGGDDGGDDDNGHDGDDAVIDGVEDLPFAAINGTETLVEGARFEEDDGSSDRRDERFTAAYTLRPLDAVSSQAFLNNELIEVIDGNLEGSGQLSYTESGSDFAPDLQCPTTNYAGEVTWDAEITGTYEYIPALNSIRIQASATEVSSPEYTVSYTYPGCSESDSQNLAAYTWPGPGKGVWGFVTIVLEGGVYTNHLDNPLADDLGETDYYDIQVNSSASP